MLPALLLSTLVAAALATAGLVAPSRRRGPGDRRLAERLASVGLGTAAVVIAGAGAAALAGYPWSTVGVVAATLTGASLVWVPLTGPWSTRAHLVWAMCVALFASYLAFMFAWTVSSPLGVGGLIGAFVLLALEAVAALLGAAYLWELCDALGRERWVRRSDEGLNPIQTARAQQPFVSLHVPVHDEPPELVIATLESLLDIYYGQFEVVVVDANTADEDLWRPVEAWCEAYGAKFAHLQDWPGGKAGALNHALRSMTDPRAEVVGVVDADYQVEPDFLLRCAPMFNDPSVGFVQTPHDYRRWWDTAFFRRLFHSYAYFFSVSQPSRNERGGAAFAGTMGLVRRNALDELGGWNEECVTEDAELSVRLLRGGWSGRYVDTSFGHGLMPLSFEAFKAQRFRSCFGSVQILRQHWRSLLPGTRGRDNRLTTGQRGAYVSAALQWYADLLSLVFYFFLLGGAVDVALGGGLLFRLLTPFLLAAIPLLVLVVFVRSVALIRRGTTASWADALGTFFIWQATSLVVAQASVQALFARRPELPGSAVGIEDARPIAAVRSNGLESALAVLGVAGILAALVHAQSLGGVLLAVLLIFPTAAYASAPVNSLAARRTALPPELAARRQVELRRQYFVRRRLAGMAGLGVAAATAAVVVGLFAPGNHEVTGPHLRPQSGHVHADHGHPEGTRGAGSGSMSTTLPRR
ncbi:MAG TPA: glycosyltransferase [Marmoricola sp.]|nr:glycosyltransferase [Marmoricola sp.]